jgi:hypothetical protein
MANGLSEAKMPFYLRPHFLQPNSGRENGTGIVWHLMVRSTMDRKLLFVISPHLTGKMLEVLGLQYLIHDLGTGIKGQDI